MADLKGFDARLVPPWLPHDAIPAGKYLAAITDSEIKPTKRGDGHYLQLVFTVVEGEYTGFVLWSRPLLEGPDGLAVNRGRAILSAVCHAVGIMAPHDSKELHNLPLVITVRGRLGRDGEMKNEITQYARRAK